jgi:predicted amidophosphoribosyltransferase
MIIFYSLESAIFLKSFLKEKGVSTKKSVDIIGVFTRPETITEEEVSVSKEKKICLVCKNEVLRANYICPECKAFYCKNCSEALSNLENLCWVCDTPFNESKPSRPFEKEDEGQKVVIEESAPKKDGGDTK